MVRTMTLPFPFPLTDREICRRRASILTALCCRDAGFCSVPVTSIDQKTLDTMLSMYDEVFLNGYIRRALNDLRITLSPRLTSAAGKFVYSRSRFGKISDAEIRMSSDFIFRLDQGPFELNGLLTATAQEAFLIVFEHELCHAIETALYRESGHGERFLTLAKGLFGHSGTKHRLPTRRQEAAKSGIYVGCSAEFMLQGKKLRGVVTYIGKSITVMVSSPSGEYRDRYGRRYVKYRVPPEFILTDE